MAPAGRPTPSCWAGGWGALLLKAGLRAGGVGTLEAPFSVELLEPLRQADVWAAGAFALEQGQIVAAMVLSALLVYVIEQRFLAASFCALMAALFSWVGLIHAWRFTLADTVLDLGWGSGREWALGYLVMAAVFLLGWRQQRSNS